MLSVAFGNFRRWLFEDVLPLWQERGVDWLGGGFHERLDENACPVAGLPRRTRVVARQIYSFAAAGRMGWRGDWAGVVDHGERALLERCLLPNGLVVSTYAVDAGPLKCGFDLYDHAFALFAMAELARHGGRADAVGKVAAKMLSAMDETYRAPVAGWRDSADGQPRLRSNPHMHMLEAMLALESATGEEMWGKQAADIVTLAMAHFIRPETGALHEFFDLDWVPQAGDAGKIVEPGHQFEWSWLLRRWLLRNDSAMQPVALAAERLFRIGEEHGVNTAGFAFDEMWQDLTPKATTARAWPQTERIKACLAQAQLASSSSAAQHWEGRAAAAIEALLQFAHQKGHRGLWYDRMQPDGQPLIEAAPASSLYHIMCAAETTQEYLALSGAGAAR